IFSAASTPKASSRKIIRINNEFNPTIPGPEEPEQAPPSPDYIPGPEHADDEIVAEDQPYAEDASPIA
nr:hypothetical protein [Tanacetum cinerariifolium]